MSSPNPLIPKSSLLEQKAKSRSGLQMVMIIVAVHMVFLGGLLFSGCRPDQSTTSAAVETNTIPVLPEVRGDIASPPLETNAVTVVEPLEPATPPLPEIHDDSEPKPPPVTRVLESTKDIVPLVPEPSAKPEVPVTNGQTEYVVAKGDNFTSIARKKGVTVQAIIKVNPAVDPNRIAVGQVLVIPAKSLEPTKPLLPEGATEYIVKSGDNLYNIAKANNTSVKAIRDINNLKTNSIRAGQNLIIPVQTESE